jgi:hypothetical protein
MKKHNQKLTTRKNIKRVNTQHLQKAELIEPELSAQQTADSHDPLHSSEDETKRIRLRRSEAPMPESPQDLHHTNFVYDAETDLKPERTSIFAQVNSTIPPMLQLVRLGQNETPVTLMTDKGESLYRHYSAEPEIAGYFHCSGSVCVACDAGLARESCLLLPVELPLAGEIGILAVKNSFRPGELQAQLAPIMMTGLPKVILLKREWGGKYVVSVANQHELTERDRAIIDQFLKDDETGAIAFSSVYPYFSIEQLARMPAIRRLLSLRGRL